MATKEDVLRAFEKALCIARTGKNVYLTLEVIGAQQAPPLVMLGGEVRKGMEWHSFLTYGGAK